MVIFTPRLCRLIDTLPQFVGVFEDDALLLTLGRRSRSAETVSPRSSGCFDSDDLAFEEGRRLCSQAWDL
jgi:hypothetical protein